MNRLQCWGTLLLDYDFKMEYIPTKELGHVDGLFRLIPKFNKPFENTAIASLRLENEIKNILFNIVSELPVTLDKIRIEAENDDFIVKIKKQVTTAENKFKKVTWRIRLFLFVMMY